MIRPEDIASLTDFKRETSAHLKRLKRSGRPQVLTINGKAAAVILDAGAYQKLAESADRETVIAGIRRGLESIERGEALPARSALEAVFRKSKAVRRARKGGNRAA